MSFDFSTLVTDRTQQDVAYARQLAEKLVTGTATEAEIAEWNSFTLKGTYNHTDLNRVTAAMEALKAKLEGYGYAVPGYQRIKVPHVVPEPAPTSRLPEGYMELTYIESTGTQYIDSGVIGKSGVEVYAKWMYTVINGGAVAGSLVSKMRFYPATADSTSWGYGYNAYVSGNEAPTVNAVHSIYSKLFVGSQELVVDGETVAVGSDSGSYDTGVSMYIFGINNSGSLLSASSARLYSMQIHDNGTLVRDFVPCKNASGVFGLYDLANDVFYQNAGSGAFTAGNEIATPNPTTVSVTSLEDETEYDQYTWYEFDWPTPETMTVYLLNVSVMRSVLEVMASTPKVPSDMVGFMTRDANDIETILLDVYRQLVIMPTTFVACGEAFCGGDNL